MKCTLTLIAFLFLITKSNSQIMAVGDYNEYSICADNTLQAWGSGQFGALGNGGVVTSSTPVQVNSLTGVIAVTAGNLHALALKSDSTVWSWGYNQYGELGDGTTNNISVPIQVTSLSGIVEISARAKFSMALKSDGTVWVWGYCAGGQLGDGTNNNSSVPVQVPSLTGIIAISAGDLHCLALKNDSTIWSWGYNQYGELGDGTNNNSYIPVPVSSLTGVVSIAGGFSYSMALKNDGSVWAWGIYTNTGQGNINNLNVPAQVTSLTGTVAIACFNQSLALKSDGTVRTWGSNYYGQFANGTFQNSSTSPVLTNFTNVSKIAAGLKNPLVLKNDGTLWTAGFGGSFALGNGSGFGTDSHVPSQVIGNCQMIVTTTFETVEQLTLSISPNPTNGEFTILLPTNNAEITVTDILDQQVLKTKATQNRTNLQLDNKGVYIVYITTKQGTTTRKLIVNR